MQADRNAETRGLSTLDVAMLVGLSYRQLDFLVRSGVVDAISPAAGQGTVRLWDRGQLPMLRFVAVLRELGAVAETIRTAVENLGALDPAAWQARILVTSDGRIAPLLGADTDGYLVDLARCRDTLLPSWVPPSRFSVAA